MKKILAAVLAAVVMAVSMTGCNNTPNESNDTGSSTDNSSSSSSSDSSSSDSSSSDSSSSDSSSSDSSSSDSSSSDDSSSSASDDSQPSGGYDTANEYGLELPNSRAGELAAKLLAADSWGNMGMLGEEEVSFLVSEDLKFDMLEDYCFLYPMITGRKMIIFIAKPKAGSEDAVKAIFDARYDYYKNDPNAAFYLAEQEDVKGTVAGVTKDGYYYLLVHPNGLDLQGVID